jgi:exopolyphosphatase/guanosine-5'-triphosphate,3'-diphosphate pyrophosphatase
MVGVFDLGSNSFISLVVDGRKEIYEELRVTSAFSYVQNGEFQDCEPLKKAFEEMLNAVKKFTDRIFVFGTEVFRKVINGRECFDKIRGNIPGKILSGEEEARYSYLSVLWDEELEVKDPLVIDLGGGSLEMMNSERFFSLPLGTRRVEKVSSENFMKVFEDVMKNLPDVSGDPVGIGGTFVTIGAYKVGKWDLKKVHGITIKDRDILNLFDLVKDMTPEQIDSLPFVTEGRGKTLKEGCAIALATVRKYGDLKISRRGYRYAIAWELEDGRIAKGVIK